jgi:predicted N-acyltransferase
VDRGFSLEVARSISEIDAKEWDGLTLGNPLASHGWLSCDEQTSLEPLDPSYVLVRREGRAVAAAACRRIERSRDLRGIDHMLLGAFAGPALRLGFSFCPALVCGERGGHASLFVADDLPAADREAARRRLLEALERQAQERSLPLCFPYVPESDVETRALLRERGYHAAETAALNVLSIEWDSFDGYVRHLRSLGRNAPRNVLQEVGRNRCAGVEIRSIEDPRPHQGRLHEIAEHHHRRHNRGPFAHRAEVFSRARELLGDDAILYGAFRGDRLTAFVLFLRHGGAATGRLIGVDREAEGNDFTYFNLVYYHPIEVGIPGVERVYYGTSMDDMKRRRGCRATPADLYYRAPGAARQLVLGPLFALRAARMRQKASAR